MNTRSYYLYYYKSKINDDNAYYIKERIYLTDDFYDVMNIILFKYYNNLMMYSINKYISFTNKLIIKNGENYKIIYDIDNYISTNIFNLKTNKIQEFSYINYNREPFINTCGCIKYNYSIIILDDIQGIITILLDLNKFKKEIPIILNNPIKIGEYINETRYMEFDTYAKIDYGNNSVRTIRDGHHVDEICNINYELGHKKIHMYNNFKKSMGLNQYRDYYIMYNNKAFKIRRENHVISRQLGSAMIQDTYFTDLIIYLI